MLYIMLYVDIHFMTCDQSLNLESMLLSLMFIANL